jgi:2-oxoglutarate ferredoxin oxidoreductase subunit beta
MLIELPFGDFPMVLGVIYLDPAPSFEAQVVAQNRAVAAGKKPDLNALIRKGQSWTVHDAATHKM